MSTIPVSCASAAQQFSVIVDVVLNYPLMNDIWVPIEIVQFDFVQGEVRVNVTTDVVRV